MQVKAIERLTLMDTGAVVQPGEIVEIEDNRAQVLINRRAAEAVTAQQAKAAKSQEGT